MVESQFTVLNYTVERKLNNDTIDIRQSSISVNVIEEGVFTLFFMPVLKNIDFVCSSIFSIIDTPTTPTESYFWFKLQYWHLGKKKIGCKHLFCPIIFTTQNLFLLLVIIIYYHCDTHIIIIIIIIIWLTIFG